MEKCSLESCAIQLNYICGDNFKKEGYKLNNLLDQLNTLDFKSFHSPEKIKKISLILSHCFSLVPPNDTFLVAKCCQLLLTVVGKQVIQLDKSLLDCAVPWCLLALQQSADIALLDILQALEAVIHSSIDNLNEMVAEIVCSLSSDLEARASMTTPDDVRVWRVQCLAAVAPSITATHRKQFLDTLWQLLRHQPRLDSDADAHVVKFVLDALEMLSQSDAMWLGESVGDVLGVVVAYLHYGLHGWQYQTPSRLFPLPGAQWEPPPAPNIKSKTKRRQKKRLSNIGGEAEAEEGVASVGRREIAPPTCTWLTSDSEVSDSEGGRTRRLQRSQARVRLAAINLLVQVAKTVNIRELFGYYSALLGSQGLPLSLSSDINPRLSGVAASTMEFLLRNAKSYFAQAQQSSVTSYTPYSSVLASLLEGLHQCVLRALCSAPALAMSLLQCASGLVDVTPYHRMRPDLLPPLLRAALPFLRHKEVTVTVAVLTLLGCVAAVEPQTDEMRSLLSSPQPPVSLPHLSVMPSRSWLLHACLHYLESEGERERAVQVPVRVEWWQLMAALSQHHYSLVRPHAGPVTAAILRDLTAPGGFELVKLHAARAFQQLATSLAASESDEVECGAAWRSVLQSQLLALGSSSVVLATAVCDCLAAMSPAAFQQLPERLQLGCVSWLLCSARDEEAVVRTGALHALAAFIVFPTLAQDEQFLCDCSDVFSRAVKDPVPLVSGKAAWALANLTDMLYKNQHGEEIIPPIQLVRTSMEAAQGNVKVRASGVRALGNLLGLLTDDHLSKPEYRDVPLSAARILVKNASATNSMKVSWNACYALGSMLRNEAIHKASSSWQDTVVSALCTLVMRSSNFKVRTNACAALSCVPARCYYGSHYLAVWRAVLEGLLNALNTTDFKEVKHQDGLLEQLCLSLCQLTAVLEQMDLSALHEVIVYHLDTMQQHLSRFLASTVPERTEAVLRAAARIALLREEGAELSASQRDALTILTDVFAFDV